MRNKKLAHRKRKSCPIPLKGSSQRTRAFYSADETLISLGRCNGINEGEKKEVSSTFWKREPKRASCFV